jgi:ATP-dependent Lon protease
VPQEVRDELSFVLVERIEDVLPAAFNQDVVPPHRAERDEPLATSTAL